MRRLEKDKKCYTCNKNEKLPNQNLQKMENHLNLQ